jgi:phosphoglycolate phosphatase
LLTSTGAGTMVAAVSCSVQKEPIVVGKPSGFLMDFLLKRFANCIIRNISFIFHRKCIFLFSERVLSLLTVNK